MPVCVCMRVIYPFYLCFALLSYSFFIYASRREREYIAVCVCARVLFVQQQNNFHVIYGFFFFACFSHSKAIFTISFSYFCCPFTMANAGPVKYLGTNKIGMYNLFCVARANGEEIANPCEILITAMMMAYALMIKCLDERLIKIFSEK